jgi:four helix bundle protein
MGSKTFGDVRVWQKAHAFVLAVYRFTERFPKHELFGLTAQLRRAAVSIPANFAEGFKKVGRAEKACFYNISQGSLEECRYYLILSQDLGYGDSERLTGMLEEVSRMPESCVSAVRSSAP